MLFKNPCQNCGTNIEYEDWQMNAVVDCPACGEKTKLASSSARINPAQMRLQIMDSLATVGGTDCPACNSSQTQRLEMTFRAGISNKRGTVVGFDLQGDVGLGSYGGTSQTGLSIAARPPAQKPIGTIYFCAFVIGILILAGLSWLLNFFIGLVAVIGFGVLIYFITAKDMKYNSEIHPQLLKRWQAAWICLRCGKKWIPEK